MEESVAGGIAVLGELKWLWRGLGTTLGMLEGQGAVADHLRGAISQKRV